MEEKQQAGRGVAPRREATLQASYNGCQMLGVGAAIVLAVSCTVAVAQAPDRAQADAAAQRAAARMRALQREADALAAQERTLLGELRKLEIDRALRVEELGAAQRQLQETQAALKATVARAAALKDAADVQRPDVEARLVQMYKMGRAGYWRLLLDLDDVRSMGRAYRTAAAMTELDRERIQEHRNTLDALALERAALEKRAKDIVALQEKAVVARAAIDRAVAARNSLITSIDERRDLNAQLAGELQSAQQRLQSSVTQLGTGRAAVSLPLRPFKGEIPWPAPGVVLKRFGRQQPTRSIDPMSLNGIELSLAEGQDVRSVHEGTVVYADQFTGYGNLVIVDHGEGGFSLYGHLSALEVERGERVGLQAPVGLSGRNPSGNPALYFELRVDGKPVDPLQWLKR
jgi:septal ring factor EnvC (AmiA/AmiB activator)